MLSTNRYQYEWNIRSPCCPKVNEIIFLVVLSQQPEQEAMTFTPQIKSRYMTKAEYSGWLCSKNNVEQRQTMFGKFMKTWPYLVFNTTMSYQGCSSSNKFTSRGLLLHRGLFMLITWKGFRPWGSSRSHWSTSDWAELHRWAGQRRGLTGAKWCSPCGKNKQTQVSMTLTSWWNQWRSQSTWPEALVLGQDAGPSARLPRPTRVPATKPAGVHKAQHSAGLLAGVKTQVGMFGQLVLRGEFEKTWHPKAKHYVHGLVCLTDLSPFRVVTLHGGQRELHLLSSGCGCDAIGLTGEGHIWALADLRLDDRASENNTTAHFVNV